MFEVGLVLKDKFFEQQQKCGGEQTFNRTVEKVGLEVADGACKACKVGKFVHVE